MSEMHKYTEIAEKSLSREYDLFDDYEKIISDLNNPELFRPFDIGLTELLYKSGYKGNNEPSEKCFYLYQNLKNCGSQITSKTVSSWFAGKRPSIQPSSRKEIYEICFALNLSLEHTRWFFHHVYFDRCFNFHIIEEATYFWGFKNNLSYQETLSLIEKIRSFPVSSSKEDIRSSFTLYITNRISSFETTEEFLDFMKNNRASFDNWNESAYNVINNFIIELTGSDKMNSQDIDRIIKRPLKKKLSSTSEVRHLNQVSESLFEDCGLLLKEIYYDAHDPNVTGPDSVTEYIIGAIDGKSVLKNSFVLERLINQTTGLSKDVAIPDIVKSNFPRKKNLSDILHKDLRIQTSESYDIIRKTLVLLKFFSFWINSKIHNYNQDEYTMEELAKIYRSETDECLKSCGYEPLFPGNPYDWLFLVSSETEDPLSFFRYCIDEIQSSTTD